MSMAEIEAELPNLSADELRRLALKSWTALVEKEGLSHAATECCEADPRLLAALDEAVARAGKGHTGTEVRARVAEWSTR